MGGSGPMKARLKVSLSRLGINQYTSRNDMKIVDKYIDRVWEEFGYEIKSHGLTGEPVTKKEFSDMFKSYFRQEGELDRSAKLSTKLKKAIAKYDRSSLYRSTDERLKLISAETIFDDPETADIFRTKAGMKKKDTFKLSKYQFYKRGETSDGRSYTVYIYGDTYIVQLNSPLQTLIMTQEEFESSEFNT